MQEQETRTKKDNGYILPDIEMEPGRQSCCNHCGKQIGFLMSQKSNKWYPVNVYEIDGSFWTNKRDFHNCLKRSS